MKTPAQFKGHPLHPMLVALPIGLWTASILCDILFRLHPDPLWAVLAFYSLAGGIAGGVLAAVPGLIDYLSLPPSEIKKLATFHLLSNGLALVLFGVSLVLRMRNQPGYAPAFALSIAAFLAMSVGGWLGGTLVYKHRVAVDE